MGGVIVSCKCPVCGARKGMSVDYNYKGESFFCRCYECGYGNSFEGWEDDGEVCFTWDRRSKENDREEKRQFVKRVDITARQGFCFKGKDVPFLPLELEGDYAIYPGSRRGKLVWRLFPSGEDATVIGEFETFAQALDAGDIFLEDLHEREAEMVKEHLTKPRKRMSTSKAKPKNRAAGGKQPKEKAVRKRGS